VQSGVLLATRHARLAARLREQPRRAVDVGADDGQDARGVDFITVEMIGAIHFSGGEMKV
jgi:hypothetical protein